MVKVVQITAARVKDRKRRWAAMFAHGDEVILVNYLVLKPNEQVDDDPPRVTMSREEFRQRHAEYGLTADGQPL
jgi:hypothetical protein